MGKKVYMIGNAHLDPVWVWRWQEGSAEVKATLRSALDRIKENDDFIFVCSSAFVYECAEEFDPAMFAEIKQAVKNGKIIIVGGWYVQPDCNLPSGEGFARQSLYAQRYFYEKFGVTAKTGYNVDSFGHNAMIPQLLKKSGMDNYVYMRPSECEMHNDSNIFEWIAPDGSSVITYRIMYEYTYDYKDMEDFKRRLKAICNSGLDCIDSAMCFYGVGNHGGGPTKHNIELIHEYMKENNSDTVVFGNPDEFFEEIRRSKAVLPKYKGDLQHHASGCYSAVSGIKNAVRRCETQTIGAEIYSVAANIILGKSYPTECFRRAWKNILFLHFHDALGGCCIESVYDDLYNFSGEALSISQRATNNALQSISWAVDTSDMSKGIPVLIFNPHSWEYNGFITINKYADAIFDNSGNPVLIQQVFSPAHNVYRRTDTMFEVKIPAFGYSTYYIKKSKPLELENTVFAGKISPENENCKTGFFLENDYLRVEFESDSGYITSIYDKKAEKQLLSGKGAVPIIINESDHDTWSHGKNYFDRKIGMFYDAEITVLENGPLRATVKVINQYGNSTLKQYFSLSRGKSALEVRAEIDWRMKERMLKLAFPFDIKNPHAVYEIPFGYIERPCNGEEEPGQKWVAICGDDYNIAMLNNNKYSYSFEKNIMNLTVVRSPMFCDHGGPKSEESRYTDIGIHSFEYVVMPMCKDDYAAVTKAAYELNLSPVNIIENNHNGSLEESFSGISIDCENIIVSAFKRSEDGSGLVLRAYETSGRDTAVCFSGSLLRKELFCEFTPHSVKTFILPDDSENWHEVLITEFEM